MRILIIGATGFIGRGLCAHLTRGGHTVTALARNPDRARPDLPAEVHIRPLPTTESEALGELLRDQEALINLAGEPLFPGRWTATRKLGFESSRVGLTETLVRAIRQLPSPPSVFVSASAIGYYGDRGAEWLTESSSPGTDFLAGLCQRWESAALRAEDLGLRVVTPRIGLVLGPEGGLLAQMLMPFRLGLGGRLGSGAQYMSWIHRDDLYRLFEVALADPRYRGPVNAVGPSPVTNREFTHALATAVHRPAVIPVPAAAMKLALGEAAAAILSSQRVAPELAVRNGLSFEHPTLDEAFSSLELGR